MARISAQEAGQIIRDEQRKLSQRLLPPTLNKIRLLMLAEAFPVCNVGPWSYRVERQSLRLFIPAYDPSKDVEKLGYAASELLDAIRREAKITSDDDTYNWYEDDGRAVANDLIGEGFGLPKHQSLVRYGVFVPAGVAPTKEEILAANSMLTQYEDFLIAEARDAYDKGPEERKRVIDSDRHVRVARKRGIDEPWVSHAHTEQSVRCQMCGKFNPLGIAKCQCGSIIDVELFKRLQSQQERMLEDATRPGTKVK